MYFKDSISEVKDIIKQIIKIKTKDDEMTCPKCGLRLIRQPNLEHILEVAGAKFIGGCCFGVGGAVPAPDYYYRCPKCGGKYERTQILDGLKERSSKIFKLF